MTRTARARATILAILTFATWSRIFAEDGLEGTWEIVSAQVDGVTSLQKSPVVRWSFAGGKAIHHSIPPELSIPRDGGELDCVIDSSKSPRRMELSFKEGEKNVFAYGIFELHQDILMVRWTMPFALAGNPDVSNDALSSFRENPYPKIFATKKNDGSVLFIMRRVDSKAQPQSDRAGSRPANTGRPQSLVKPVQSGGCPASPFAAPELVVASVKEVPAGEWTFGKPPTVIVEVEEVLRGTVKPGSLKVIWGPAPHSIDYGDPRTSPDVKAWKAKKLQPPKVGEKWILWMRPADGAMSTSKNGRWPWSKENLATARLQIEKDKELPKDRKPPKDVKPATDEPQTPAAPDQLR